MPKYKAAAYIRLSYTDDHSSESDSVSNQRKLIENFVERNPDIEVVSEKIDDGYSGIIFDRPAFKEMMQDVTDGNINCVIVKDLSRLGREYIETGRYLRRVFPAYGVRFIAITDSIDTAHDSGDDLTVSVKNIMNEAYCRDISIKTRSSLDVKRRNGDFVGAFPVYGYMKAEDNKNLLVPDPYAARVVYDIFRIPAIFLLRVIDLCLSVILLQKTAQRRNLHSLSVFNKTVFRQHSHINEKALLSASITAAIKNDTRDKAAARHIVLKLAGNVAGEIFPSAGIWVIFIHIRPQVTIQRALRLFIGSLIKVAGICFSQ